MSCVAVVGVSAVGGGGKTEVTRRLAEVLGDAVALHFDDYDDTNVHPGDLQRWSADGANYDAYQTPVFSCHLQALKAGKSIRYPIGGKTVGPSRYVVADAPLGRAHSDSGRFIDLMVFIDTPLDVAMARRVLRDIGLAAQSTADEALEAREGRAIRIRGSGQAHLRALPKADASWGRSHCRRDPRHRPHRRQNPF